MDQFDLRILAALQEDGRLTNFDLAERVGLSASQCSRRRQALEQLGAIETYHARLSAEVLGLSVLAFVQVSLSTHSQANLARFVKLVESLPEVQEAYSLTGETDYLVKLVARDLRALSQILNDVLLQHESIAHVRSSIVLGRLKEGAILPIKGMSFAERAELSSDRRSPHPKRRRPAAR